MWEGCSGGGGGKGRRWGLAPSVVLAVLLLGHLAPGDAQQASPVQQSLKMPRSSMTSLRSKRSSEHVISDCIMVTSQEGEYFFKSPAAGPGLNIPGEMAPVCGVYFVTDPERRVELTLNYLRVPCETGGLLSFMDGWEMNGELFPSIEDHPLPLKERFQEFCSGSGGGVVLKGGAGAAVNSAAASKKRKKERGGGPAAPGALRPLLSLRSTQNAALVQYRVPPSVRGLKGRTPDVYGFSFSVRFPRNPTPCNILVEGTSDVYTLRNYGRAVNCSLATLFPARLRVLSLSVGSAPGGPPLSNSIHPVGGAGLGAIKRNIEVETGTIHKCDKRGMPDYVEVGGAPGLDTANLAVADSICGMDSRPGSTVETIMCGVSTVRLVSSGWFDNAVTVALREAADQDVAEATLVCPITAGAHELPEDLSELEAELGEMGLEGFGA
ncbi:corticotropin-releasing factor-binding protein [Ischnura elegans]|uniref:corticotropin-releasing factor-binding protein n=1 Tax=Ischnura elegans TaxID=197161 RepID=UPI001ED87548|nr:corticotropin-releasing factor-binding protein [Ischnura elegans]